MVGRFGLQTDDEEHGAVSHDAVERSLVVVSVSSRILVASAYHGIAGK